MMAQLSDLTRPVVRTGTGFHRHDAPGLRCYGTEKLHATDALAKEYMPGTIRSVHLEHVFHDVKPIVVACSKDASFGGDSTPPLWHTDTVGGRPTPSPIEPVPAGIVNGRCGWKPASARFPRRVRGQLAPFTGLGNGRLWRVTCFSETPYPFACASDAHSDSIAVPPK